jgi:(p)ppGpp synthase/HD superfamily hydrolase
VLATVAAGCADQSANIEGIELSERDEHYSTMRLTIGVRNRKHLADIIRVLRGVDTVLRVHRKRS